MFKLAWLTAIGVVAALDKSTATSLATRNTIANYGTSKAKINIGNKYDKLRIEEKLTLENDTISKDLTTVPGGAIGSSSTVTKGNTMTYKDVATNP